LGALFERKKTEGVKGGSALFRPLNSSDWKALVDMVENKDADLGNTNLSRCENRDANPGLAIETRCFPKSRFNSVFISILLFENRVRYLRNHCSVEITGPDRNQIDSKMGTFYVAF
jgi:hypothetical protein